MILILRNVVAKPRLQPEIVSDLKYVIVVPAVAGMSLSIYLRELALPSSLIRTVSHWKSPGE